MVKNSDLDLEYAERITSLEVRTVGHDKIIQSHSNHLLSLDKAVTELIHEVRGVRRALYLMAGAVAANVPALRDLLTWIKHIL